MFVRGHNAWVITVTTVPSHDDQVLVMLVINYLSGLGVSLMVPIVVFIIGPVI